VPNAELFHPAAFDQLDLCVDRRRLSKKDSDFLAEPLRSRGKIGSETCMGEQVDSKDGQKADAILRKSETDS